MDFISVQHHQDGVASAQHLRRLDAVAEELAGGLGAAAARKNAVTGVEADGTGGGRGTSRGGGGGSARGGAGAKETASSLGAGGRGGEQAVTSVEADTTLGGDHAGSESEDSEDLHFDEVIGGRGGGEVDVGCGGDG